MAHGADRSLEAVNATLDAHDRDMNEFRGQLGNLNAKIDNLGQSILSRMDMASRERTEQQAAQFQSGRGLWVGVGSIAVAFTGVLVGIFSVVGGQALDPIRVNQTDFKAALIAQGDDIKRLLVDTVTKGSFNDAQAEQQQLHLALNNTITALRDATVPALAELRGITGERQAG